MSKSLIAVVTTLLLSSVSASAQNACLFAGALSPFFAEGVLVPPLAQSLRKVIALNARAEKIANTPHVSQEAQNRFSEDIVHIANEFMNIAVRIHQMAGGRIPAENPHMQAMSIISTNLLLPAEGLLKVLSKRLELADVPVEVTYSNPIGFTAKHGFLRPPTQFRNSSGKIGFLTKGPSTPDSADGKMGSIGFLPRKDVAGPVEKVEMGFLPRRDIESSKQDFIGFVAPKKVPDNYGVIIVLNSQTGFVEAKRIPLSELSKL